MSGSSRIPPSQTTVAAAGSTATPQAERAYFQQIPEEYAALHAIIKPQPEPIVFGGSAISHSMHAIPLCKKTPATASQKNTLRPENEKGIGEWETSAMSAPAEGCDSLTFAATCIGALIEFPLSTTCCYPSASALRAH